MALRSAAFEGTKMRDFVAEAVRFAVAIEKKSYELYRHAAVTVPDQAGRQIFERLAREESRHIDALLREYPGIWQSGMKHKAAQQPRIERNLAEPAGDALFDQLHLALLDKRWSIDFYTTLARAFREPRICRIFELALAAARKEFRFITDLYLHAEIPFASPRTDRPPRRTHIRNGIHPAKPNKHSQLFFSLLDAGRQSQPG